MIRNNKGMTLLEVVLAVFIISIAGISLGIGFNSVINAMQDAELMSKAVRDESATLMGDDTFVGIELTTDTNSDNYYDASFVINGKTFTNKGSLLTATSDDDSSVKINYFKSNTIKELNAAEKMLDKVNDILSIYNDGMLNGKDSKDRSKNAYILYMENKCEENSETCNIKTVDFDLTTPTSAENETNSNVRNLVFYDLYKGNSFPIISSSKDIDDVIKNANTCFDKFFGSSYKSFKLGDKTYYLNPYVAVANDGTVNGTVIFVTTAGSKTEVNNTNLIYIDSDNIKGWYYKNITNDSGSKLDLEKLIDKNGVIGSDGKQSIGWNQFINELKNNSAKFDSSSASTSTKWYKLD